MAKTVHNNSYEDQIYSALINVRNFYNYFLEYNFILFPLNRFILFFSFESDKIVFVRAWRKVLYTFSLNT